MVEDAPHTTKEIIALRKAIRESSILNPYELKIYEASLAEVDKATTMEVYNTSKHLFLRHLFLAGEEYTHRKANVDGLISSIVHSPAQIKSVTKEFLIRQEAAHLVGEAQDIEFLRLGRSSSYWESHARVASQVVQSPFPFPDHMVARYTNLASEVERLQAYERSTMPKMKELHREK